ncbi:MAG TPA: iron-sulfur cluster repair di-iron protein [Sediminibacterium sp.]
MKISAEETIGAIVAKNISTAPVFENFGLDFCCHGNRTLAAACNEAGVDPGMVISLIEQIDQEKDPGADYDTWPLDQLADHIESTHHAYVTRQIPLLAGYLAKICSVHGKQHPELFEIKEIFADSAEDLTMHMHKEEKMLFPFIRKLAQAQKDGSGLPAAPFGSAKNPIQVMMREHDAEGSRFQQIAALSRQYTPPADACNTYKATLAGLQHFENDLHIHIHLENNILFPEAVQLESTLSGNGHLR